MRDFQPDGAQPVGQRDDRFQIFDIMPVDRRIDGERHAQFGQPSGDRHLLVEAALDRADAVGILRIGILERDLHMIEAALDQPLQPRPVQRHRGRDQVGIQPRPRTWATMSSRSVRKVGSPPERWSCTTPISAAWLKTFRHSSVLISRLTRSSSSGLEQ